MAAVVVVGKRDEGGLRYEFSPDFDSCNLLFDKLVGANARKGGRNFLHQTGLDPEPCSLERYIRCLCENNSVEEAVDAFSILRCDGTSAPLSSSLDVGTLECLIQAFCIDGKASKGFCLHGETDEAYRLFKEMPQKGIVRDIITFDNLIRAFCMKGKAVGSLDLLHELLAEGLQPSASSYAPIIKNLCRAGHIEETKNLLNDMQSRSVELKFIAGLCEQGYIAEGLEWLGEMLKNKLKPRQKILEKLVRCLSERDKFDDSLLVLDFMFRLGYALKISTCHSIVTKFCQRNAHLVEPCLDETPKDSQDLQGQVASSAEPAVAALIPPGLSSRWISRATGFKKKSSRTYSTFEMPVDLGSDMQEIINLKQKLSKQFAMKDLGAAKQILRMRIKRDTKSGTLMLSQVEYINKVLSKFNMQDTKPVSTPLGVHFRLSKEQSPKTNEERAYMVKVSYASAIGSLMYVMVCTRPDIAHAVGAVSRYMNNPGKLEMSKSEEALQSMFILYEELQ
ncbi:Detected protein of confused Function [Hibiscus syriacus]|uniref:Detected protein of confused Function n=1 Tax=Hibiscus syriacus TaxID=106335 RepID=A0A6A2YJK4_HIBSY|nr:Detected protein of confused Function [Hibiscus syriacus]